MFCVFLSQTYYFIPRGLFWYITVLLSITSEKKGATAKEFERKLYLIKITNCLLANSP